MLKDKNSIPNEEDELVIEYFTVETFKKFLFEEDDIDNPKRPPRGIL